MRKNILVVVDMQNDFIYGTFFNKNAHKIVKPIFNEIQFNTTPYDKIIFTKDTHENKDFNHINHYEKTNFEGLNFKKHCVADGDKDIVYPLSKCIPSENITIGLKNHFDGSDRIVNILDEEYPTEKEGYNYFICGVCTDICVLATAIGLTKHKLTKNVTVITSLCAGTSKKAHKNAIEICKSFKIQTLNLLQFHKKYIKNKGDIEW